MHTITSADGTPIAYDRTGAGPPLVLVGGAFSSAATPARSSSPNSWQPTSPSTATTAAAAATAATPPPTPFSVRSTTWLR